MTMEANEFISNLKADTAKDLVAAFDQFRNILGVLQKDRAPFSLNVLCVLCRNIDKAPKWRENVDNKALLTMSIECVRETRAMERPDRIKTLACIYHIHKHIVKQNVPLPPESVLKLSFMAFELDAKYLLKEYHKTYWNILVDRIEYIEKMKNRLQIVKLLPTLTEHALKVVEIYDTVQFCTTVLIYLVKRLYQLYNDRPKELNTTFRDIFMKVTSKDMKPLRKLQEKDNMDIYNKLNDCLFVIAENASKTNFVNSPLDVVVRSCISIVSHCPDLLHCLQTFYLNAFCSILTENFNVSYSETVLNGLFKSFETIEKSHNTAMIATYPFIKKIIRLYIEYTVNNSEKKPWNEHFDVKIQTICLKLILKIMDKLEKCNQLLKCENCSVKTGLHDALRLSFQIKHFVITSMSQNIKISDTLPLIHEVIFKQYEVTDQLKVLGCVNYEKCFQKLQSGTHNTAISLNKSGYYDSAIKLFDLYLKNEFSLPKIQQENLSRALFNKSICELEAKMYESAIIDAFLSLVLNQAQVSSEKYMSLVIDIKAKEGKANTDCNDLQLLCILDACQMAIDKKLYGDLTPFLKDLKFSELIKHEFYLYAKLWPSLTAIGGVWRGLLRLVQGKYGLTGNQKDYTWVLYEVVLETPNAVRSMTSEYFDTVVNELLEDFERKSMKLSPDLKLVYSSLLLLKCESELAAASLKYGWKPTEQINHWDPDQVPANRTIPQEHAATRAAIAAVHAVTQLSPNLHSVSNKNILRHSLQICQVFVQQLLQLSRRAPALQLASVCCALADCVGDDEAYVRSAGTLLYHGAYRDSTIARAAAKCKGLAEKKETLETAIVFISDYSMYYSATGRIGASARFAQLAQAWLLDGYDKYPDINLDLGVGRLLEANIQLCKNDGPSLLSAVNNAQRHYLSTPSAGTTWSVRRLHMLTIRVHCARACIGSARAARSLLLWRRARAAAVPALPLTAATSRAHIYTVVTDVDSYDDAQIKIDNRLKHFLGLQPSNETQPYYAATESKKLEPFTPKQEIETMLENLVLRKSQTSPSIPCSSVPAFKIPDFFNHDEECDCYACDIPVCYILACQTSGLEASMYFRANENDIARNYFNGVIKMLNKMEERLRIVKKRMKYDDFVVESAMKYYWDVFRKVQIEILIELAFFELKNKDFDVADEVIVEIHDVMKELSNVDEYMTDSITNLMVCSAQLRQVVKRPNEAGLEVEFASLKLSPNIEPPKTPVNKVKIPKAATNKIVKDDELPKKRKVIKLNLDDDKDPEIIEDSKNKKPSTFKMPVLKHVLEAATPKTLTKPRVVVTDEPSTPMSIDTTKFCTPKETPDQFFTPLTSVKTYKKVLRHKIAKNLEREFSTPLATPKVKETEVDKERSNVKETKAKDTVNLEETKVKSKLSILEDTNENLMESVSLKDKMKKITNVNENTKSDIEIPSVKDVNGIKPRLKRIPRLKNQSHDDNNDFKMKENQNIEPTDNKDFNDKKGTKMNEISKSGVGEDTKIRKISKLMRDKVLTSLDCDDFKKKESTKLPAYLEVPGKKDSKMKLKSVEDSKEIPKIEEPCTSKTRPTSSEKTKTAKETKVDSKDMKENVNMDYLKVPSNRKKEATKKLKRATSPGKLGKESELKSELQRPRRLKKPMSYGIDDDRR